MSFSVHPNVLRASSFACKAVGVVEAIVITSLELASALIQDAAAMVLAAINFFFACVDKRAARNLRFAAEKRRQQQLREEFAWRAKTTARMQAKYGPRRDQMGFFGVIRFLIVWSVVAFVAFQFVIPAFTG